MISPLFFSNNVLASTQLIRVTSHASFHLFDVLPSSLVSLVPFLSSFLPSFFLPFLNSPSPPLFTFSPILVPPSFSSLLLLRLSPPWGQSELRECGALVGHAHTEGRHVVQRPVFGDQTSVVTSDATCAKIFDLRTGRPRLTAAAENCHSAGPIDAAGGEQFMWMQLYEGGGLRIWDLRMGRALYSLPVATSGPAAVAFWHAPSHRLFCADGSAWSFGVNCRDHNDEEVQYHIDEAWGPLVKQEAQGCAVM